MACMGLTFDKILVILVIALIVLGPERLPYYAQKLGELVKGLKRMADGAKERVKDEMGPEFEDVDWAQLDPRQYDPRRIIRDALQEDDAPDVRRARAAAAMRAKRRSELEETAAAPDGVTAMGVLPTDDEAPAGEQLDAGAMNEQVEGEAPRTQAPLPDEENADQGWQPPLRREAAFNYDEQAT